MRRVLAIAVGALALATLCFGYGVLVGQYHVFPYRYLKSMQDAMARPSGRAKAGAKLFAARCSGCHGRNGEGGTAPDLHTDIATSASHRRRVQAILRKGIPGTAMPDLDLSRSQIANLMAFLVTLSTPASAEVAAGDIERGHRLFAGKGRCLDCHRVDGTGGWLGPDLSDVGSRRWPSFLRRSLTDPGVEITPGYRAVRLTTRTGSTVVGIVRNQSAFSVQVLDTDGHLRSFQRAELRSEVADSASLMPSYQAVFDSTEIADVVAYLSTLRGSGAR